MNLITMIDDDDGDGDDDDAADDDAADDDDDCDSNNKNGNDIPDPYATCPLNRHGSCLRAFFPRVITLGFKSH